ncbi:MAG: hypothetical protein IKK95_00955 [Lachnospiraceae bacterium]|nr:hypothetical protein [Lachnospiraceae bacterium]
MEKLDLILEKMDVMQGDIRQLKADVAGLKTDVAGLKTDVASLKTGLQETNEHLQRHEAFVAKELSDIKLQLENEVTFGIRAVADGHFDLGRKLDDVIDQRYHKEQLYVRMLHLSTQIDKIKRNCRYCA